MKTTRKPTSLDYAILGLVNQQPQTGYGIRKAFETTALGNYSSSPGVIYPALKRLQELGLVVNATINDTKKSKFHCTEEGESILKEWLLKPIEVTDIAKNLNDLLLRFAFMENLLNRELQLEFLSSFQDVLKKYIKSLKEYHKSQFNTMPLNARLAFEHGIDSYTTTLKWCVKTISDLKKQKNEN
ncbi:PadR family transcriptional regulator [Eudoraea adriatica]|uniref:PadR family transcriptional regulator n=1 Tax=Eudoraea adriatica TaxID=446681 RepID=UPI00035E6383|nr:PadR family transcriptional regulator [Eudoraea adriatica]